MPQLDANRRFQFALNQAREDWATADHQRCAARAGCKVTAEGIMVPFFGMHHLVTHPAGEVIRQSSGQQAHATIVILLLHYLLTADGIPPADRWLTFRELPDGLFYAQAFANHGEGQVAGRFGADVEGFRLAAAGLNGSPLDLADASFLFQALPRLNMAVLLWEGDDEFPGQARILFDAHAGHYLPTEDLAGLGDWLAHRLVR